MNKVIVKGQGYVKGNTVLKPQRQVNTPNERNKSKNNKKIVRKANKNNKDTRNALLQIALVVFVLGVMTIWRDTKVYKLQSELGKFNTEISHVKAENEALKVDLLKNASLKNIEKNAKGKLNMIESQKADKVSVDLSKNYLEGIN
ncbi:MAG: hypothetical protein ACRDCB_10595 [Clostridium sp.]|uniref:cell division protein FtsL n=1 Tax=Clostridium TaxID=1485 RepID=UPI002152670E|nr:cell division protein FtsL [Clostridium sp. LY3-2]MCR6515412.1 cell division protein FtsL [Clostridium sp. LY3-2]